MNEARTVSCLGKKKLAATWHGLCAANMPHIGHMKTVFMPFISVYGYNVVLGLTSCPVLPFVIMCGLIHAD